MDGARATALIGWAEGFPAWGLPAVGLVTSLIGLSTVFAIASRESELVQNGLHFKAYGAGGKFWLRRRRHGPVVSFSLGAAMGLGVVSLLALAVALFAGIPPNEATLHAAGATTAASGFAWAIRAGIWRRRGVHN